MSLIGEAVERLQDLRREGCRCCVVTVLIRVQRKSQLPASPFQSISAQLRSELRHAGARARPYSPRQLRSQGVRAPFRLLQLLLQLLEPLFGVAGAIPHILPALFRFLNLSA